jgi:hypothetical protein
MEDTLLEIAKVLAPLIVAYIGLLRTRTDLDILYAKYRGGPDKMRKRWYHRLKANRVNFKGERK